MEPTIICPQCGEEVCLSDFDVQNQMCFDCLNELEETTIWKISDAHCAEN